MMLVVVQSTSELILTLNVLPLTVDVIVELQERCLQHMHLLASHFLITGYTLCLLYTERLLINETRCIADLIGESNTLGPL